jgi:hypothetical protein
MHIDMEVAFGFDRPIDGAVFGETLQHVIEKTDPGGHFGEAAAVQVHGSRDLGFFCLSRVSGVSGRHVCSSRHIRKTNQDR